MKYQVVSYFEDLQDHNHAYNAGDPFPRDGLEVSEDRIKELSGEDNKRGYPLIRKVTTGNKPRGGKKNADRDIPVSPELV